VVHGAIPTHWLYRKLDDILGHIMAQADTNTFVVLSSDHGAISLHTCVRLNNLFAREGLLKFTTDATGAHVIDWARSRAVYLNMFNVYVNPEGLAGNWRRASGPACLALREKVKTLLLALADEQGGKPLEQVVEWENASRTLHLLPDRAGDLILANRAGYCWSEEMTDDFKVFSRPLISGYKQGVLAGTTKGLWTPFVIAGPGIKRGHFLGPAPIQMVDQYPTLLRLLGVRAGHTVQGKVIEAALDQP